MAPLSPSLRLLVDEIHQTKNLSSERVIPIMGGMANKDWTDALLDRLAATRTRKEIEAYQVTARISRIALHIARHQEEVFGRFGLNRGEVGVLGALLLAGSGQQLSPTQLFKGLMLSSAGITSRLDRLERRGYVKRSRHPSDRRGVLVNLTVAGNKVLEQAVAADAAGEQELLSALTKEDRGALVLQLKKLLTGLEPTP
ncbi:MAG: MarR family transcriptional regulator [Chloroflexi bacterium]|nr:MAG: MarR family transcriptional regulator [Chloroflexota bacterium]TMG28492.1 MAG: MarR family transcriptional regulator [Chloroflexota bacterium]TMG67430.1 MAG: MarR family transcriptional regulator [Chloroflexota bacterium]